MTGCLLVGAGPVLEDRYERGARKVSWIRSKVESPKKETELTQRPRRGQSSRRQKRTMVKPPGHEAGGGQWAMQKETCTTHHMHEFQKKGVAGGTLQKPMNGKSIWG